MCHENVVTSISQERSEEENEGSDENYYGRISLESMGGAIMGSNLHDTSPEESPRKERLTSSNYPGLK